MSYFEKTKVTDSTGTLVNPATEESVLLLRRIVKQLEASATQDSANRQIVSVATGALSTLSTVTTLNQFNGVDPRYLFMDTARNAYANGIRSKLT
jgi:hypothetical protein